MVYHNTTQTNPQDGTFRFVGLPGEVVISARAQEPRYTRTEGEDIDRLLVNRDYHTAAVVRPARGVESATCDLALVPGRMLAVTVVGPDGQPLAGALVRGLQYPDVWGHRLTTPGFSMLAPTPEEPRLLQVVHPEKNLAGSLVMRGDEPGPLTVRLGPAGVLTGRFVTTDGKPLADLHLSIPPGRSKSDVTIGSFLPGPRTDEDGKFRIEGLAPGLTYSLALLKGHYLLQPDGDMTHGVTVKPGETKDLGDVKIKRPGP
jgi:hypothetical protein